jgi:chromosome segregation ATPase
MSSRTAEERRLKTDIHVKNALRGELSQSLQQLHTWQERIHDLKNTRRSRKLTETVARYAGYVNDLREYIAPMLDDLETRIKAEMKFSEEEIAQFQSEVKQESIQAAEAKAAFLKAKDALEHLQSDEKAKPEQLHSAREAYRRAFRTFRLEKRQLTEAKVELKSELVDREIFKSELKRIMVERSFISG